MNIITEYIQNKIQLKINSLNNRLIEEYCKTYQIDVDYNLQPEFNDVSDKNTLAIWLAYKKMVPPKHCYCYTYNMILAFHGIVPEYNEYNNPSLQTKHGFTVAMYLAYHQIIPPQQWMHDLLLENEYNQSLFQCLQNRYLPIPYNWDDDQMTIFDQACFGIIPDITDHQPDEQNEDGFTVAMILALNKMEIPKEWRHDPYITNTNNCTVAMCYAFKGIIPPKEWYHTPTIIFQNITYQTTFRLLIYGYQQSVQNNYREIASLYCVGTVAMLLASRGIIPPEEWQHDPELQDNQQNTVAMLLAFNNITPPKYWRHDKFKQNYFGINGTIADKNWFIDCNQTYNGQSYSSYLLLNKTIKYNNIEIDAYKFQEKTDMCQICFDDRQQKFVKTLCGHIICKDCFYQLIANESIHACPICKTQKWLDSDVYVILKYIQDHQN